MLLTLLWHGVHHICASHPLRENRRTNEIAFQPFSQVSFSPSFFFLPFSCQFIFPPPFLILVLTSFSTYPRTFGVNVPNWYRYFLHRKFKLSFFPSSFIPRMWLLPSVLLGSRPIYFECVMFGWFLRFPFQLLRKVKMAGSLDFFFHM